VERPAYSYLALGALRGWADSGGDRTITAGKVNAYVAQVFRAAVRDRSQTPTVIGNEDAVLGKSAGERGPDIGEIAKAETDVREHSVQFKVSALPEVPRTHAPSAAVFAGMRRVGIPGTIGAGSGMDFGSLDVDALEKYDAAVKFEKGMSAPEEKAARWRKLGSDVKAYANVASKRAQEWDAYAAERAFNAAVEFDNVRAAPEEKAARWREVASKAPKYAKNAGERAEEWNRYGQELKSAEEAKRKRAELRDNDWPKLKRMLALSVVSDGDKQKFAEAFVKAYGKSYEDNPYIVELQAVLPNGVLSPEEERAIANDRKTAGMVLIPAGEFWMGSPDGEGEPREHPRHKVYLDALYIDKYDVTVADYRKFAQSTGRKMEQQPEGSGDDHPVVYVRWDDAKAYCESADKRLPTEAEWEKAARGGTDTRYHFGDDVSQLNKYVWYSPYADAHPVGKKWPNQYGLYDMHGHVSQWVADWFGDDYYGKCPSSNPKGPGSGQHRVVRGGCGLATYCREAFRAAQGPTALSGSTGFRCARNTPE